MSYSLTWLPEVLEKAGLKVAEAPGWRTRGRGDMGVVRGVMCHHTVNGNPGNMPSLNLLINGRKDLPGPLSQLGLGRDGCYYVIAAGRANHAGAGKWESVTLGNSSFIGIEAEHSGNPADPWPAAQKDAYARGVAALLKKIGAQANMCCGHKEYALPAGRKPDPCFDMPAFRSEVASWLAGKTPPPADRGEGRRRSRHHQTRRARRPGEDAAGEAGADPGRRRLRRRHGRRRAPVPARARSGG